MRKVGEGEGKRERERVGGLNRNRTALQSCMGVHLFSSLGATIPEAAAHQSQPHPEPAAAAPEPEETAGDPEPEKMDTAPQVGGRAI